MRDPFRRRDWANNPKTKVNLNCSGKVLEHIGLNSPEAGEGGQALAVLSPGEAVRAAGSQRRAATWCW